MREKNGVGWMGSFLGSMALSVSMAVVAGATEGPGDFAARLPSTTGVYFELSGGSRAASMMADTDLFALWNEEELQDFLEPARTGIRSDLDYLMREAPESVKKLLASGLPERTVIALPRLEIERGSDDPKEIEIVCAIWVDDDCELLFDDIQKYLEEEGEDEIVAGEVEGRRSFSTVDEEDDSASRLILDDHWLILQLLGGTEMTYCDLFASEQASLASTKSFQEVRSAVAEDGGLTFGFVNFDGFFVRMMGEALDDGTPDGSLFARLTSESPWVKSVDAIGFGVVADGGALRDRLYIHAPGDRSAWDIPGVVGDAPSRHANWIPADSDLLISTHIDLAKTVELQRIETERTERVASELDVDPEADGATEWIRGAIKEFKESTGVDLEGELVPTIGHEVSLFGTAPSTAMAIPEWGVILELADGAKFDEIFRRLIDADDELDQVSFTEQTVGDRNLVSVQLVNASIPVVPTLCRLDNAVIVTSTPQAMKGLLRGIEKGESLGLSSEEFQTAAATFPSDGRVVAWCDLGRIFEYLYGFVGLGLSAARMQGAEMGERFDGSLLPTAEVISEHLGIGIFSSTASEQGITYEGRSTLGNPFSGTLFGITGIVAMIGFSEGTREAAEEARSDQSIENMIEIGKSMEAYKGSVGGGSYPENLVLLVDRGLLRETDRLVDPFDARPRRSRTGSGDRIPISYAIGTVDVLSAEVRETIDEGASTILYTREAWHDRWGEKHRLVLVLGADDEDPRFVSESDWGGG